MKAHQNHLIAALPAQARTRLLALGEDVQLTMSEVLCEAGGRMKHVYFPIDSFVSLVAITPDSSGIEVGMVGEEGMLGGSLALGVPTNPLRAVVQGSGAAWRADARAFSAELESNKPLSRAVHRYLYVLMAQQASSAVCLRFHRVGPRLARWLLMSQDRARASRFNITHEFLAYMLGVRRVGITNAATLLQRAGLIEYRRGEIHVLDRPGLERAACTCYSADRKVYAALLG